MMAICAPNYFNGSLAWVSEFRGVELLIAERDNVRGMPTHELGYGIWIPRARLSPQFPGRFTLRSAYITTPMVKRLTATRTLPVAATPRGTL